MAVNRGKQFEDVIKEAFEKVPNVSVDRLHDQTNGFLGSSNICDFIVYKFPKQYYFECKAVHGNIMSIHSNNPKKKYGMISNKQWEGLSEKEKIRNVQAGIIVWFIDKDKTYYIPIWILVELYNSGKKSVNCEELINRKFIYQAQVVEIKGIKKRVFFDYDMEQFLKEVRWLL